MSNIKTVSNNNETIIHLFSSIYLNFSFAHAAQLVLVASYDIIVFRIEIEFVKRTLNRKRYAFETQRFYR
jgi:hypothetical protein